MHSKFDIRINAAQRHYILTALAQCKAQGYYGADADGKNEIDDLHAMFEDDQNLEALVDPNSKNPGNVLNDFTA